MPLRLLQVYVPEGKGERVKALLGEKAPTGVWLELLEDRSARVSALLPAEETEGVIDLLDQHFGKLQDFQVVLLPVEATVPLVEEPPAEVELPRPRRWLPRVSTEELYGDIDQAARLNGVYVFLVVLSSIVAAIGILRDDFIVIIGAMVIAPLLGPNAGLALATTLGDISLAKRSFMANAVGIVLAVSVGVLFGLVFPGAVDPTATQFATRTQVNLADLLLAITAGGAGAVAFTVALPAVLVGVMVAVALLPPSITLGMLLGSGHWQQAVGNLLLLQVFLAGINLAAVVTLLVQGVHPRTWWESERAKRATRVALLFWIIVLTILVLSIYLGTFQ